MRKQPSDEELAIQSCYRCNEKHTDAATNACLQRLKHELLLDYHERYEQQSFYFCTNNVIVIVRPFCRVGFLVLVLRIRLTPVGTFTRCCLCLLVCPLFLLPWLGSKRDKRKGFLCIRCSYIAYCKFGGEEKVNTICKVVLKLLTVLHWL